MSVVKRACPQGEQLLKQNKNALTRDPAQQVEPVIVAPPPGEAVAETDGAERRRKRRRIRQPHPARRAGQDAGKDALRLRSERRKRHRQLRSTAGAMSPRLGAAA